MIKTLLKIIFIFFLVGSNQSSSLYIESIKQFKWNSRIILIRPLNDLEANLSTLRKADSEIQDRHINWFIFSQGDVYTNFKGDLTEDFQKNTVDNYFSDDMFGIILIGKDGGIKKRAEYLNLKSIFELIDSMPMRKIEMEKQANYNN